MRYERKQQHYDTAEEFSKRIMQALHYSISSQTLLKIERGEQQPNITQFIALNIMLFDSVYPTDNFSNLYLCERWKQALQQQDKEN